MRNKSYDVIVLGLDPVGSATVYELAKRGLKVLGLENPSSRKEAGNTTRIIRESYHEVPGSVKMTHHAIQLWRQLEAESGIPLLRITGGLVIGAPDSLLIRGSLQTAHRHNLLTDYILPSELSSSFPQFSLDDRFSVIFEPNSGVLFANSAIAAYLQVASRHGAQIKNTETVTQWYKAHDHLIVETTQGLYRASQMVISGESWVRRPAPRQEKPQKLQRRISLQLQPAQSGDFIPEKFPVFTLEVPEGRFEGFPLLPGQGLKIELYEILEAEEREINQVSKIKNYIDRVEASIAQYLPGAFANLDSSPITTYMVRPYKRSLLERHPVNTRIIHATGLSEQDFGIASMLGEGLAEMVTEVFTPYSSEVKQLFSSDFVPQMPCV
ncbi:MAG: FAD-dependent oxidoreductase [Chloroflexi bacterium]|uniref:FAD-dependent oxidoreductase n=1 Tax=Candidatus Chlorohelix allophototropha TaxID=3003348 RepID=A0A8T7LZM5_9CHLR|nr:FAD-dependent oxidoreductase [Chloroflexota bacterium]WJW65932.1 FAD-dependent oxidoreductase [Chloroflexota bacterium L227-S17]